MILAHNHFRQYQREIGLSFGRLANGPVYLTHPHGGRVEVKRDGEALILPPGVWHGWALDTRALFGVEVLNTTASGDKGTVASFSFAHTCTATGTGWLIVGTATGANATGVTYNSVAMSELGWSLGTIFSKLWGLQNPASGSNTVEVTCAGASDYNAAGAITLRRANSLRAVETATGTSTTPTQSVTSAANELVIDVMATGDQGTLGTITVGAGQTQFTNTRLASNYFIGMSYEAGAASVTMDWTTSISRNWSKAAVAVYPQYVGGAAWYL